MNFDEKQFLNLVNALSNAAYNSGCADESPQQSYKQQDKWYEKTRENKEKLIDYVLDFCRETEEKRV